MQLLLPLRINSGDRVLAYGKEECIYEGASLDFPRLHVVSLIRTGKDKQGRTLYTKWTLALHNIQLLEQNTCCSERFPPEKLSQPNLVA